VLAARVRRSEGTRSPDPLERWQDALEKEEDDIKVVVEFAI
jgi:hypothetical protein